MQNDKHIKEIHGLYYYTGNHPNIRSHYRAGKRPTEFGNKVWATSLILIDYLSGITTDLKNYRVLEVGCGWGLLGVYLAKQYSCKVTCTDLDQHVLPIVDMHAELNNVNINTEAASFSELTTDCLKNYDLIIGAEVCYSEEVAKEITEMISRAHQAKIKKIFIADPGRPDFDICYKSCHAIYKTQLLNLPGSVNGKTTQLLSANI